MHAICNKHEAKTLPCLWSLKPRLQPAEFSECNAALNQETVKRHGRVDSDSALIIRRIIFGLRKGVLIRNKDRFITIKF